MQQWVIVFCFFSCLSLYLPFGPWRLEAKISVQIIDKSSQLSLVFICSLKFLMKQILIFLLHLTTELWKEKVFLSPWVIQFFCHLYLYSAILFWIASFLGKFSSKELLQDWGGRYCEIAISFSICLSWSLLKKLFFLTKTDDENLAVWFFYEIIFIKPSLLTFEALFLRDLIDMGTTRIRL